MYTTEKNRYLFSHLYPDSTIDWNILSASSIHLLRSRLSIAKSFTVHSFLQPECLKLINFPERSKGDSPPKVPSVSANSGVFYFPIINFAKPLIFTFGRQPRDFIRAGFDTKIRYSGLKFSLIVT